MEKNYLRLIVLFIFLLLFSSYSKAFSPVEGEVIVILKEDIRASTSTEHFRSISEENQLKIKRLNRLNILIIKSLDSRLKTKDLMKLLEGDPMVEKVEPNYRIKAASTFPNDPDFPLQWALHNYGQNVNGFQGTVDADIDMPQAWDYSQCSDSIVVAVLDTGIDYTHPDITANIWKNTSELPDSIDNDLNGYIDDFSGWDFVNNDNDPLDDNGHGTHVSGIIGAEGNNNIGITGVCWRIKIMTLKVLDANGSGSIANVLSAIDYAIDNRARIINASYVGTNYSQSEYDAIQKAKNSGILFVAAAGNNSTGGIDIDQSPVYPASYNLSNIIVVAASDINDNIAYFSNYGQLSVDVSAPGVNILSLGPSLNYIYLSGTSMAAPHVTGLCALVWSIAPSLSLNEVKSIILNTVDIIDSQVSMTLTGGRINAYRAVLSAFSIKSGSNATSGASGGGGGCFIATATYGSFLAPEVTTLRNFRDRILLKSSVGKMFVRLYYKYSPDLAKAINNYPSAKKISLFLLTPVVYVIKYPEPALSLFFILCASVTTLILIVRSRRM